MILLAITGLEEVLKRNGNVSGEDIRRDYHYGGRGREDGPKKIQSIIIMFHFSIGLYVRSELPRARI